MINDEIIKLSKSIFPDLRKGTHLSTENCKFYQEVIENQEEMFRLYKSVGFDLIIKDGYINVSQDPGLGIKMRLYFSLFYFRG